VFYAEGVWDLGVVLGKADFFPGFAAGYLEWRLFERVCLAARKRGLSCSRSVSRDAFEGNGALCTGEIAKSRCAHGNDDSEISSAVREEEDQNSCPPAQGETVPY
jgi:hypothetical protein